MSNTIIARKHDSTTGITPRNTTINNDENDICHKCYEIKKRCEINSEMEKRALILDEQMVVDNCLQLLCKPCAREAIDDTLLPFLNKMHELFENDGDVNEIKDEFYALYKNYKKNKSRYADKVIKNSELTLSQNHVGIHSDISYECKKHCYQFNTGKINGILGGQTKSTHYEENTKAMAAVLFCGLGVETVGDILSLLNLTKTSAFISSFYRHLDEMVGVIQSIVRDEMDKAMLEEMEETIRNEKSW